MIEFNEGLFIAIEGIDGAGKTTQAIKLDDWLKTEGYDVVATKEPTEDSESARKIRDNILKDARFSPEEELELFMQDRREHIDNFINPAIASGKIVICDRYYFSNIAYQGASGLDPEEIRLKNEELFPIPDAVFYLNIGVDEGLNRVKVRNTGITPFEKADFLIKAKSIFEKMEFDYFHTIDAAQSIEHVFGNIEKIMKKIITDLDQ